MKRIITPALALLVLMPAIARIDPLADRVTLQPEGQTTITIIVENNQGTSVHSYTAQSKAKKGKLFQKSLKQALKDAFKPKSTCEFMAQHTDESFKQAMRHTPLNAMMNGVS
jgi:hypothetical protein